MRFTIFELFGWITFLAVLFAILSQASWPEAMVVLAWFAATILALKFTSRRTSLKAALSFGGVFGAYAAYWTIQQNDPFVVVLSPVLLIACTLFGWIIWGIVLLVDTLIASAQSSLKRPTQEG